MCESGVGLKEIVPYLSELTQVDGRMERIERVRPSM